MDIENWPCPNTELQYEKGENRFKHSGTCVDAKMVYKNGIWVGVCPKGFLQDVALELLQHAIPEFRSTAAEKPHRLWSYHDGVIYAARTENGGRTWHGYPNGHPKVAPPKSILKKLEQRAREIGEESRLQEWLRKRWDKKN